MKKRTKPDVRRIQGQLADTPVTRENRIYLTYVFARLVSPSLWLSRPTNQRTKKTRQMLALAGSQAINQTTRKSY